MNPKIKTASLVLAVGLVGLVGSVAYLRSSHKAPRADPVAVRVDILAVLPPAHAGDVVFLGDSIIESGEWGEFFASARNRAVGGATTSDVMARLDRIGTPSVVVLSVGINDLIRGEDVDGIIKRYELIVAYLVDRGVKVVIVPVLPVNTEMYERHIAPHYRRALMPNPADVERINAAALSFDHGVYVVSSKELCRLGELAPFYTYDGLHLNGAGLAVLTEEIAKVIPADL